MTRLVVITRAWPYPPGEQFVSGEAPFWVRDGVETIVMPWRAQGSPTMVPAGLTVDLTLARRSRLRDLRSVAESPLDSRVRAELLDLVRGQRLTRVQVTNLLRTSRGTLLARDQLRAWIRRNGPIDVLYSYWFDAWTLGALMLKGQGIGHVATRVHGYDLFEDRNPAGHMPLRRALVGRLDLLLPVAASGGRHAVEAYGIDPAIVHHAPLGVDLPPQSSATSPDGELHLLSVASCLPVKRIDRLADAVALAAREHPQLRIRWTHLGGGPLLDELRARVEAAPRENLAVEMPGQVDNRQVNDFLASQSVDLFVNTSESEGVPVAVMEAMAHGVPAMAPRVGAMEEIVTPDGRVGLLLDEATPRSVADGLWRLHRDCKQPAMRTAAQQLVANRYARRDNHEATMDLLLGLTGATKPTG